MSIICKNCGFENDDGSTKCILCEMELTPAHIDGTIADVGAPEPPKMPATSTAPAPAPARVSIPAANTPSVQTGGRYYVNCENSRSKTYVPSDTITSFYCSGCKEEHQIDDFFWTVQEEENLPEPAPAIAPPAETSARPITRGSGQHLVLEDMQTHVKIEIDSAGGTFGRYGTFGSEYLQSDPRGRMVSGEHCRFKYQYGHWTIEHLSRTNDTVYNGHKLEHGYEESLKNGKIITFANAMSFIVTIY